MKITDEMGLLKGKKGSNQYKKKGKSKAKSYAIILGCLAAIGAIIYAYNAYMAHPETFKAVVAENAQEVIDELTPEQRATVQKEQALIEKEAVLNAQKAKLDADYKVKSDDLEKQLEAIRSQKLSLSYAPKQ